MLPPKTKMTMEKKKQLCEDVSVSPTKSGVFVSIVMLVLGISSIWFSIPWMYPPNPGCWDHTQ